MSDPNLMNLNNNEESSNSGEKCVSNDANCNTKRQHSTKIDNSSIEDLNLNKNTKDNYSQQNLFGMDDNISNPIENNSNLISNKEVFSNGINENPSMDITSENKCLKYQSECHHKQIPVASKLNDNPFNLTNGNITTEGNKSDATDYFENTSLSNNEYFPSEASQSEATSNNECIDANKDQHDESQPLSSSFNVVPNPNEFNLLGKSIQSPQNPDFLNLNRPSAEILAFSDNSIVISNSNAIPQSDSIVSSNYSLSQLLQYSSDDDDEDDDCAIQEPPATTQQYREGEQQMEDSDDSDSSTSSSTSIIISETSSDSDSDDEYENFNKKEVCKPIKAKGEMEMSDLPPIEDLAISVPEEECIPVGKIYQIVDQLVIVQANKDTPAYDLDTVMFTQGGKPLGQVFDVMGPVTEPYYCIRFNSKEHVKEKNIALDQIVYVAPKTQYSKFVFLAQLMKLKGSDASWENDIEPPEIYLDYSDDEQEQRAKKKFYKNKKAVFKTDSDPDEPARKRHSAYVKKMNARNLRLSAARGNQNPNKNRPEKGNVLWKPNLPPMMGTFPPAPRIAGPCHQMFGRPPLFDMRVPSPNSPFPSHGGPQFHQAELFVHPQIFIGPSTSSRAPGPSPFPQPAFSPGRPFIRQYAIPGPSPFPRPCASTGHPPFPRPCTSTGPPPCISPGPPPFPRHSSSPGPPPFPRHSFSQGAPPFPRPCASPVPPPFSRPCASPGTPPFPRSCASPGPTNDPRINPFSPPPPHYQPANNLGHNSIPTDWNLPWARPFTPTPPRNCPPPQRNANPSPIGSFPSHLEFPNRANSPRGPQFNTSSSWSVQPNQGNCTQFNFNPSVPPPSPDFFQN